jgi:esterase/lipase superfamily enzyme
MDGKGERMAALLTVSCRKDFWSATEFSATNEARRIDLDTGAGTVVQHGELLRELANKRMMILIHGYNNEELDVVDSYRTIDKQMRLLGFLGANGAPYDALLGFAWPGGATGVSFPFARQRAAKAAPRFARLMSDLRGAGATIDLNTHSLGAHVLFEALREGPPQVVRNAWNFASAVDNESIEVDKRYYSASLRCERCYVFHSRNDPVLRVWYRIGDALEFDRALGDSGPEDPAAIMNDSRHVRVINCKDVVTSHGGYRSTGQVWAYMSQEITRPSADQFVTLSKSPEALTAVFRAVGGSLERHGGGTRGRARHARASVVKSARSRSRG